MTKEKKERCKRETDGRTPLGPMRIAGDTFGVETSSLFHPFRVPTHGMTKSPGLTPWAGLLDPFGVLSGLKPGPALKCRAIFSASLWDAMARRENPALRGTPQPLLLEVLVVLRAGDG